MTTPTLLAGLAEVAATLSRSGRRFALVGGIAVAVRGEPRFTRDVDLAIATDSDADVESLVFALRREGYDVIALVEHEARNRLETPYAVALRRYTGENESSARFDTSCHSSRPCAAHSAWRASPTPSRTC